MDTIKQDDIADELDGLDVPVDPTEMVDGEASESTETGKALTGEWQPVEPSEDSRFIAAMAWGGVSNYLAVVLSVQTDDDNRSIPLDIAFSDDHERETVERIAAVVTKYGGQIPDWMRPWWEEIQLIRILSMGLFFAYQAKKTAESAIEADGKKSQPQAS